MPVSVTVEIGSSSKVTLARAILLYSSTSSDAFASVHEITGLESGQPALAPGTLLTAEGLRDIHKALYRQQQLELLPEHVLAVSPERLVWFEPARERVLFFETRDAYLNTLSGTQFPQPALLFIAGARKLQVFALDADARPTAQTPLYTAPYFNTTTSGVCLGSTPLPESLSVHDTDDYSSAFFHSAFTHGTSERLLRGWGGSYGQFWTHVQQSGMFPTQHLVALDTTLETALHA